MSEEVRRHYVAQFGEPTREAEFAFDNANYEVYKWDAGRNREGVNLYATNGASDATTNSKHRFEFFVGLLPAEDDVAVTLAMVASFPRRTNEPVGDGHTISFDEPLWPGTRMRSVLLARPIQDIVPDIVRKDGVHINFLQVLPLFDEEVEFKKEHGVRALVEAWRKNNVRFWDPQRSRSEL